MEDVDDDDDDVPVLVEATENLRNDESDSKKKVPITIITGYLGAGKTTLLNYILTAEHGKKIAVLLNEFGNTTDIEKSLTVAQDGQEATEWIPLANGCICCSIKDSGVAALESLVERQKDFDYILLETTGVADPGNIAPMFWMDEGLGSSIYLDGIVTVVDAKNILVSLDEPLPEEIPDEEIEARKDGHDHSSPLMSTAHLQISHADVLLLNKSDLVSPTQLENVKARVASINGVGRIIVTDHSKISDLSGTVLDLHAYSSFPTDTAGPEFAAKGHSHLDPTISTLTIELPLLSATSLVAVEEYLQQVVWPSPRDRDYDIHRTKGILRMLGGAGRDRVVQGVREIFEMIEVSDVRSQADVQFETASKLVFIGRGLSHVPRGIELAVKEAQNRD